MPENRALTWEEEKALHTELTAARDALAEQERQRAYAAVSAALSSYRWWGWTNIINTIRCAIQAWRQRRALKVCEKLCSGRKTPECVKELQAAVDAMNPNLFVNK